MAFSTCVVRGSNLVKWMGKLINGDAILMIVCLFSRCLCIFSIRQCVSRSCILTIGSSENIFSFILLHVFLSEIESNALSCKRKIISKILVIIIKKVFGATEIFFRVGKLNKFCNILSSDAKINWT